MSLRPRVDYFHYFTNKERLFKERVARLKQLAKNGSALEVKRMLDKLKAEIEDVKAVRDTYRAAIKQLRKTGECEVNVSGYTIIDAPSLPSIRIEEFQQRVRECNRVLQFLNREAAVLRFELARRKIRGSVTLPMLRRKALTLNRQIKQKLLSLKEAFHDSVRLMEEISNLNREFTEVEAQFQRFNLNPKAKLLNDHDWFSIWNRLSYKLMEVKSRIESILREIKGETS
mgnify:CR=1 FL=1